MKNYLEKELYELLRKDNTIFDFIQYTMLDGLWYWDLDHPENEWMNSRFWTTLGYNPDEMPHSPDAWHNIINKDDLALALENFRQHLEDENHPYDQEVRYTHKNGSVVWIRCYGKAIRDKSGKPIRMLGLHIDITKIKNSAELLRAKERAEESEKELLLKNAEYEALTEELRQTNDDLNIAKEHTELNRDILEKLNQKLEFLFDNLPIGISILNADGKVVKNNKYLKKILNVSNQALKDEAYKERKYLKSDYSELEPTDFPSSRVLKGEKEVLNFEIGIHKEDNSIIWTNVNATDCTIDNWKVVITTSDVTENKKNRDELQMAKERAEKNEKNFIRIIDTVPVVLYDYILHPDGRSKFLFVSPNCQEILELKQDELLNDVNLFWSLVHADDLQRLKDEDMAANKNNGVFYSQARIITPSGKLKWVEIASRAGSFVVNHPNIWSGYIKDITGQKNTEIALIAAKEKAERNEIELKKAQEITHIGSWYLDIATNEVTWTEELYKMYGFDPKLPPPPYSEHAKLFTPESWNMLSASLVQTQEKGMPYELELQTIRQDKSNGWMWVRGEAIFDKKGRIVGLWGAAQDITDRKNTEQELRIAKENAEQNELYIKEQKEEFETLNEELLQTNAELLQAKERAEESDNLKTAFLQNMSHEIRTPMNAIMGFSSLMVENFNDIEKLRYFSAIIDQRCNDLLDIINDILDIAKIESGQSTVNIAECDLAELFSELGLFFRDYQTRTQKQNIQMVFQPIDANISKVRTDNIKLKQILINLISNAFKYTKEGLVQCGVRPDNDKLLFYVSDTGIGIPEDKFNYIFERFAQLKHPFSKNTGGTGLGLSIVKGLVALLGGKVWLESEYNKGTTFYFTIDYIRNKATNKHAVLQEEELHIVNSDKIILIVEDDKYNALYLQEILYKSVSNIFIVGSGTEAINFIQKQAVDIILMDIRLPDITGYEATQAILQLNPDTAIIAQTAYAASDERQKALAAGCVDYISKPTRREYLLTLLGKYL